MHFSHVIQYVSKVSLFSIGKSESAGHFATEEILKNIGAHTYQMVCDSQNLCVNPKKTLQLIESEKINYVFVDRCNHFFLQK